ncbi:hypothetical protein WJX74_000432 [Apatococcus lobatus]|uniref:MMS19 nucleotide excision repair protein n=1 Tax=Apatococcus lobatus TaxID=904363 RepID=A0AAW1S1H5_9CHLO
MELPLEASQFVLDGQANPGTLAYRLQKVAEAARSGLSLLDLVRNLRDYLIAEEGETRARATLLLAKVLEEVPSSLTGQTDASHVAAFFAARLSDWPSFAAAIHGCETLLRQAGQTSGRSIATADAKVIATAFTDEVEVPGLAVALRQPALRVLQLLLEKFGTSLLKEGVNLIGMVIAATDAEKDPRCLMLAFSCFKLLGTVYAGAGCQSHLQEASDDLFDFVACYFPLTFTPPPDAAHNITRESMASELEATIAALPSLAEHVIPLLLEKLASSVRQSRADSLSAVKICVAAWGIEVLDPQLSAVWRGLRNVLLSHPDCDEDQEVVVKAGECLRDCVTSLAGQDNLELVDLALEDSSCQSLPMRIQEAASGDSEAAFHVSSAAFMLGMMCAGSGGACSRICQHLVPSLAALARSPSSGGQQWPSEQLNHQRLLTIQCLQTVVRCIKTSPGSEHAATDPSVAEALSPFCSRMLQVGAHEDSTESDENSIGSGHRPTASKADSTSEGVGSQVATAHIKLMSSLASFPFDSAPLDMMGLLRAARQLSLHVTDPQGITGDAASDQEGVSAAAAQGLASMAGAGKSSTLMLAWVVEQFVSSLRQCSHSCSKNGPGSQQTSAEEPPAGTRSSSQQASAILRALGAMATEAAGPRSSELRQLPLEPLLGTLAGDVIPACSTGARSQRPGPTGTAAKTQTPDGSAMVLAEEAAGAEKTQKLLQQVASDLMAFALQESQAARTMHDVILQALAWAAHAASFSCGQPSVVEQAASTIMQAVDGCRSAGYSSKHAEPAVAVAGCVVAACPPSVLPGDCRELVQQLTALAVHVDQASLASQAANVAAASILAKLPPGAIDSTVSAALAQLLPAQPSTVPVDDSSISSASPMETDGVPSPAQVDTSSAAPRAPTAVPLAIQPLPSSADSTPQDQAADPLQSYTPQAAPACFHDFTGIKAQQLHCLGWVLRALAMRGAQSMYQPLLRQYAQLLRQLPSEPGAVGAAAGMLETCFSSQGFDHRSMPGRGLHLTLGPSNHVQGRLLWQQRLLTVVLDELHPVLQAGPGSQPQAGGALWAAYARLMGALPDALAAREQPRLLPFLPTCLLRLADAVPADAPSLVALLNSCAASFHSPTGLALLTSEPGTLISGLMQLAAFRPAASVRSAALHALALLPGHVSWEALHSSKAAMAALLRNALDDIKRPVRQQAAVTKLAWT